MSNVSQRFKTIIEPFRIKMVEPLRVLKREEREKAIEEAHYNLFLLKAKDILIDLLTDSGTGAMSAKQWSGIMSGDESYAGCRSFYHFENIVKNITGFDFIFPTHQGRAAEWILFTTMLEKGQFVPNNTHFDTTRANVEYAGGIAEDLVIDIGNDPQKHHPFKGNMNIDRLKKFIEEKGADNIPLCILTVTNNAGGGQPVSMENIKRTKQICSEYGIPLFLDACRFAENAYFIKTREKGYGDKTTLEIAQEMFSYADGCTMSAKKDGLVNIGGFLACRDSRLAEQIKNLGILTEGYPTYGGLAGRDLEAIAIGLEEVLDEQYLEYRISSTQYLGRALRDQGIPVVSPIGGHAVFVDAKSFLPHIPAEQFPGHALACSLYIEGNIRSCEIGTLMFGKPEKNAAMELVRLAIPRRTYTQSHIDYVIEVFSYIKEIKDQIHGYKIIEEPNVLRHFSAKLMPV